jgi:membrane peptidoglycan carboxypeptidase
MINAIIAVEDKRYWENPWVDIKWLFRAWINYVLWKTDWVKWTSTLTQQLIRNTVITNERSLERKIKEIYLAYKLTSSVSKEKILELYLNKISYWHNAFGIEEAAKTYFGKSAKEIWVLESSILASLPKWPTFYSPYNHPDRVVGYPYIYTEENEDDIIKIISAKDKIINNEMLTNFINFLNNLKASRLEWTTKTLICNIEKENFKNPIRIDNDWCAVIEYSDLLSFLNSIKIQEWSNFIEYQTWRKDEVLGRMLEDWYIDFEKYKESIINAIWIKFVEAKENIKSPHFVFYVKEYLEEKYWQEIVSIGWLKIYTTLDPKLQEKAEEIIEKQTEINKTKFAANNAALISIDNKNWEILSMVWWRDYFDKDNKWNVNIITSKLQPWSTFKPFVYSMGIFNEQIWTKTPIYDLETEFSSDYTPANFDWKFIWKMNISTALNNSRNIPAIKMFYMAGWEKNIVSFMKKLWVNSLKTHGLYWAPLALWTWEMTPLELATAYSVFANMWVKKEITPILKIVDSKWNIIEEKTDKINEEKIISENQTYIINNILSDTSSRPEFWNNYVSLKDRIVSAKTGTSTKQYMLNGKKDIYPANLWTAWYTPQITTVVWAWNTDWKQLNYKWNWLEWAWPIWKEFMEFAHIWKSIETWEKPSWVKEINISEISWLLPNPEKTNESLIIKSLFINEPTKYDNSYKQVKIDSLCNWIITDKTPDAAIKNVTLVEFNSLSPNNPKWQDPVIKWSKTDSFKEKYWNIPNLITEVNNIECKRSGIPSEITIRTTLNDNDTLSVWENFIELAYKSSNPIIKINVYIWNSLIEEIKVANKNQWSFTWKIFIPASKINNNTITLEAVDNEYYSNSVSKNITIIK